MPIFASNVEKNMNPHISLIKQFCETILIHNDLTLLSELCKEDIVFYNNITSKNIHGISSLGSLKLYELVSQPSSALRYEVMEASIDSMGLVHVTLNILCKNCTFHIVSTLSQETDTQKNNKYLISRIHLFHEKKNNYDMDEQKHAATPSDKIIDTISPSGHTLNYTDMCDTSINTQNIGGAKQNDILNKIDYLYNNTPSAIMCCNMSKFCVIEFANNGFYTFIGYNKGEFSLLHQSNIMNLIHASDVKNVKNILSLNSNNGNNFSFTCRILPKNGNPKWVNINASTVKNEQEVEYIYFTCQDITGNYEMLQDLMLMKEKMEIAIRDIGLHYWDYFPNQDKVHFIDSVLQKNAVRAYNNVPESTIKRGLISEGSAQAFREIHAKVKAGEPYVEAVILGSFSAEKKHEWHKIRYTTIFDDDGKPCLAIGTGENVNAYKEVEHRVAVVTTQTGIDIWKYNIDAKVVSQEANLARVGISQEHFENVPEAAIDAGLVHEADIEKYREMYRKLDRGVSHVSCDLRVKSTKDDEFIWTRLFYTILPDKDGQRRMALGSALDISDQKAAEAHYENEIELWNLRTNKSLLSCVLNISANTIVSGNGGLNINTTNGSAKDFLNSFASSIVIKEDKDSYSKKFSIENILQQFSKGIRYNSLELQIFIKKESAWISFTMEMIKNVVQNDVIAFVSVNDITEEKMSLEFTQEFLTSQFDGFFRINFAEDTYNFYAAPHIQEILPYIPKTGKYSEDIVNFVRTLSVEDKIDSVLEEFSIKRMLKRSALEGKYNFIAKVNRAGEKNRYKRIRVFQRDDITKTICIVCVDITDLHEQSQEHIQTLRDALVIAKKASKAKSKFLASMSHDLRTPMNAIIGMTNLALEDQNNPTQVTESLDIIKSSSEQLLALLNDILEMSRLESGKATFNYEVFSIIHECTQIYNLFRGIANQKQQKMSFECTKIRHDEVMSNKKHFGRILTNLLGNAIKFTPNAGEINIILEEIEIPNKKNNIFRITIKDSGIGIEKENLGSIFEPFNRAQGLDVNKIEGTGLGLAIVKNLVDGLGGVISVESNIGKGSTFILELAMLTDKNAIKKLPSSMIIANPKTPTIKVVAQKTPVMSDADSQTPAISDTHAKTSAINDADSQTPTIGDTIYKALTMKDVHLNSMHILLVDDHLVNILVASKMLQKMGAKITTAKNGKEAYDLFYDNPAGTYKLIFMDLQMPIMSGYESTFAIRNSDHSDAKTIPIIAISANAFAEDVAKCKQSDMNYHIAKPISIENILKCLIKLNLL